MPYFPNTYPPENWWAGRTYVREAERILACLSEGETSEPPRHYREMVLINLERATRTLFGLPSSRANELTGNELAVALPDGYPWKGNNPDLLEAVSRTRVLFFEYFKRERIDEYNYYGWEEAFDSSTIAVILGLPEEEVEQKLADEDFDEKHSEIMRKYFASEVSEWMALDHDKYWNIEEYEFLAMFGQERSGAFAGADKVAIISPVTSSPHNPS